MTASVIYKDATEGVAQNAYEIATQDWSSIDHVELSVDELTLSASTPGEFWRLLAFIDA